MGDLSAAARPASAFLRPGKPRLAYRLRRGAGPALVFLPGYRSDMSGSKALALDAWAAARERALLRFDYSGCGESGGDFEAATLADWRDEALALIDAMTEGPVVLVGSSMGGWLMLLIALARPARIAALVGIAAAPDFTDWGFTLDEKMAILTKGRIERPSDYDMPSVTTRAFWQSGEVNRVLDKPMPIACPIRLIHGQRDADVPWNRSLDLAQRLGSADVQLTLVKDGDHRLSRPQDIALLLRTIESLPEPA